MKTALVTGASVGLGRALARALARRGWHLVVDARHAGPLRAVVEELSRVTEVEALVGDITDAAHRAQLAELVGDGSLDLLVHNASTLGPGGLTPLALLHAAALRDILETNLVAPADLTRQLLGALGRARGTVLSISSDAAVEHYETWGGYGASKAALDHLALTLAAEHPDLAVYAVDPGDMRTAMHQAAFPGEDISDRPGPETVVDPILRLLDERPPSGRFRASDLAVIGVAR
ncbi:SDR family NAD(P)-dependent oxidoreductase [Lapillicoccus sp.]|uniref:SDR family NAD(P)-dependent oxidoreductase n=1 Tax=Lapillicoccus sp. TaxID=1909287 RepID=UPI003983B4E2